MSHTSQTGPARNTAPSPRIKVCGLTDPSQAVQVSEAGADAVGFVFAEKSPRLVSKEDVRQIVKKLPPLVQAVGVFVDESADVIREMVRFCGLDMVQLHGSESPGFCKLLAPRVIKAFRVKDETVVGEIENYRGKVRAVLLDAWSSRAHGGTGKVFDWEIAKKVVLSAGMPVILAGGLNPDNVGDALSRLGPWGVDVSSGVETSPGKKDMDRVRRFIKAVKKSSLEDIIEERDKGF